MDQTIDTFSALAVVSPLVLDCKIEESENYCCIRLETTPGAQHRHQRVDCIRQVSPVTCRCLGESADLHGHSQSAILVPRA